MRGSAGKIQLASLEDFFGAPPPGGEAFQEIPLAALHPFKGHPFHVTDDEKMREMAESVTQHGILVPGIVRPRPGGGYELVSGHRRKRACELAGLDTMPVFVRDLDNDEAVLIMVDSNLQRERVLPSEKAFAYRMKLDAMKRQGKRSDLTCVPVAHKLNGKKSRDILAEQVGESQDQIRRYIRLTYVSDFCQPVYEMWLSEAVALGRVKAPGFFSDPLRRAAWCNARWIGPVQGSLDPLKEAKAAVLLIQNGLKTHNQAAREMGGGDWDEYGYTKFF